MYKDTKDSTKMKLSIVAKTMSDLLELPEKQVKNYLNNQKAYFTFKNKLTKENKVDIRNIFNSRYKITDDRKITKKIVAKNISEEMGYNEECVISYLRNNKDLQFDHKLSGKKKRKYQC